MRPLRPDSKLNLRALSLSEALRAFCAVALPLLVGEVLGIPQLGLAALGALLTCFSDPGGPVARRVPAVVSYAVLAGVGYGFFGWLAAINPYISALIAGLVIFCASFARIFGQSGMQVGNLLSVAIVLALGAPNPSWMDAILRGGNFWAGASWAALLTLVIWQTHPHAAARRALADVARKLAILSDELSRFSRGEGSPQGFDERVLEYRGQIREAIETARSVALETFRRKGLVSVRGAQISLRLESFERIFGALIALSEQVEGEPRPLCPESLKLMRLTSAWLRAVAAEIVVDKVAEPARKQASLAHLQDILHMLPDTAERHILAIIVEQLAVMTTMSQAALSSASAPVAMAPRWRVITPIRQNLTWSSSPFRHAVRVAIIATPVLAITSKYGGPYAHWATITLIFCLQPYFAATWSRTAERCGGTVLGGMIAAGIGFLVHTDFQLALAMLPLTLCAFALRSVNFGLYIAAITPMVVLLVEQLVPSGKSELYVAMSRVLWSLLGGGLSVLGSALLWPGFEAPKLSVFVETARREHLAYVNEVFAALLGRGEWGRVEVARRAAGLASNNLEASLARALAEPHGKHEELLMKTAAADAAMRRLAGRLSLLAVERPEIPAQDKPLWQAWETWLQTTLGQQKNLPRPSMPSGPGAEDLLRLARQVELIMSGADEKQGE